MRLRTAVVRLLAVAGLLAATTAHAAGATAAPTPQDTPSPLAGGSGPYPASYVTDPGLPNHTVYRPDSLPSDDKLPIVAWGNGACAADGTAFENALTEWASHGFLVIANGEPGGSGTTNAEMLTEAVDWAIEENSRDDSPYHDRLDTEHIAVMGMSCGGLETYQVADDPRLTTTVIWNSGLIDENDKALLANLHAPIAYFIGGPSDIAYPNAMDDWQRLPEGLPAFMGNLDVGHGGTYHEENGGEFGRVGSHWLKWQLKGDEESKAEFVGDDCGLCDTDWDIQRKNLS